MGSTSSRAVLEAPPDSHAMKRAAVRSTTTGAVVGDGRATHDDDDDDGDDRDGEVHSGSNARKSRSTSNSNNNQQHQEQELGHHGNDEIPNNDDGERLHRADSISDAVPKEVLEYYAAIAAPEQDDNEAATATGNASSSMSSYQQLQRERVCDILRRFVPTNSSERRVFLDVGCGNGFYSAWLLQNTHFLDAILIDPVRNNVHHAFALITARGLADRARVVRGDASCLPRASESAHYVLMYGPLYHLLARDARRQALVEANRVLHVGGILFAVAMSRFAFTLSMLFGDLVHDQELTCALLAELESGQHREPSTPSSSNANFTSAHVHTPLQLRRELSDAGFDVVQLLAVEGPLWLLAELDASWQNAEKKATLLQLLRRVEAEPSLLGTSAHIIAVARKR